SRGVAARCSGRRWRPVRVAEFRHAVRPLDRCGGARPFPDKPVAAAGHARHGHTKREPATMKAPAELTKNQALVLNALSRAEGPLSAYTILDRLRDDGFRAPLQVYRALEKLQE